MLEVDESVSMLFFDAQIAAGFPSPGADYAEKRLCLNDSFIKHPYSTFLLVMKDDSMRDAYMPCGAKLLMNESLVPQNGDIVVAYLGEDLMVRYFEKNVNRCRLIAANKNYEPLEMTADGEMLISGVVIKIFIETTNRNSAGIFRTIQKSIDLDAIFVKNPLSSFIVSTIGNSMNGAFIPDKSKLFIDKSRKVETGDIVVVSINGGFTVKYIEIHTQGCRLIPANDRYTAIEVTEEMQMYVWGVVFLIIIDPKDINYVWPR